MCSLYHCSFIANSRNTFADTRRVSMSCLLEYSVKRASCLLCAAVALLKKEKLCLIGILTVAQKWKLEGE